MLAVVKYASGDGFIELQDMPEPEAGPGEVKIRVRAAGVCGSDLHIWKGDIGIPVVPPVILGHEFAGEISAVGPEVDHLRVGQRVTAENSHTVCGHCDECMSGDYNLCSSRRATGYAFHGAFAAYCVVPAHRVHVLPDNVDFVTGALTDPSACAYRAVCEKGQVGPGDTVLILGAGPMGLFSTQYAVMSGAKVIVAGTLQDHDRLRLAKRFGAHATVDVADGEPVSAIREHCGSGAGPDVVLECSGAADALRLGVAVAKRRARLVLVGIFGKPLALDMDEVLLKEMSVVGMFSQKHPAWVRALAASASGQIRAKDLVTDVLPLREWERGFRRFARREAIKVVLQPGEGES